MAPIMTALAGTLFLVLGFEYRAKRVRHAAIYWFVILAGVFNLFVAYEFLTTEVQPFWIRLGTPLGGVAGWALARARTKWGPVP